MHLTKHTHFEDWCWRSTETWRGSKQRSGLTGKGCELGLHCRMARAVILASVMGGPPTVGGTKVRTPTIFTINPLLLWWLLLLLCQSGGSHTDGPPCPSRGCVGQGQGGQQGLGTPPTALNHHCTLWFCNTFTFGDSHGNTNTPAEVLHVPCTQDGFSWPSLTTDGK